MDVITESEALAAEAARYHAQTVCDFEALERMLGDDLVYYHSSSVADTKQSYLDAMRSGTVRYRTMSRGEARVRIFGHVAIITGNAKFEVTSRGEEKTLDLLFHSIWVKRSGALQFISWQATRRT